MKLYALFTLHKTGWGTREGIDEPEKANDAMKDIHPGHYEPPIIATSPRIKQKRPSPKRSVDAALLESRVSNGHARREEHEMEPVAL